mmetsp:Transcript_32481/g.74416  ORF Transcript_32481/g.74416 Transcript_32481/m.74416 type:complete len:200 (+) Transcript_32481:5264-5863(+)
MAPPCLKAFDGMVWHRSNLQSATTAIALEPYKAAPSPQVTQLMKLHERSSMLTPPSPTKMAPPCASKTDIVIPLTSPSNDVSNPHPLKSQSSTTRWSPTPCARYSPSKSITPPRSIAVHAVKEVCSRINFASGPLAEIAPPRAWMFWIISEMRTVSPGLANRAMMVSSALAVLMNPALQLLKVDSMILTCGASFASAAA